MTYKSSTIIYQPSLVLIKQIYRGLKLNDTFKYLVKTRTSLHPLTVNGALNVSGMCFGGKKINLTYNIFAVTDFYLNKSIYSVSNALHVVKALSYGVSGGFSPYAIIDSYLKYFLKNYEKEHTIYDVPMVYGFMWGNIMALIGTAVVITLSLFFFGHIITLFLTMIMFTAIMAMMD